MLNRTEIRLGEVIFDAETRDLRGIDGARIDLRNKSSEVLAFLAARPGEIVSKANLMEAVWPDVTVSDESLTQCIADIRRTIGDKDQAWLKTHVGKGYSLSVEARANVPAARLSRLIAVAVVAIVAVGLMTWKLWPEPVSVGPPRIAVLAFDDLSSGDNRGYMGDGIAEGIITELARYPELSVIARNSSFIFRGQPFEIDEIARQLRADFVVEGSVQKSGDRLRATVQLINGRTGTHDWAHEFNAEFGDYFDVQSKIVLGVATHLGRELGWREPETGGRAKAGALHLYFRGNTVFHEQTPEAVREARDLYLAAIETDPRAPYGYVGMSLIVWHDITQHWVYPDMPRDELLKMGVGYAEEALALAPDYYMAHISRGDMHDRAGENELAVIRYQHAALLNPSSSDALALTAEPLMFMGRTDEAIAVLERAIDINPIPEDWYYKSMGFVLWAAERCDEAIGWLEQIPNPQPWELRHLMVNQACAGDLEAAHATAARHVEIAPDYTVQTYLRNRAIFNNDELFDRFVGDLRKAGMPEG